MQTTIKRFAWVIGLLLLILLGARLAGEFGPARSPDISTEIFGTAAARTDFAGASAVTVERLRRPGTLEDARKLTNPYKLSEYEHGPVVPVPGETARQLQNLFQRPESFGWTNTLKSGVPHYDVLFTFHHSVRDIRLALCFKYREFGMYQDDNLVNTEQDFDPVATNLLALVKTLFPDDPGIQSLRAYP